MKMELINTPKSTIKETILHNRGIKDLDILRNPSFEGDVPSHLFKNMIEATAMFVSAIKNNKKIGILVDCDQDGFSSAAEICYFFKNIIPFFHSSKQHGLTDIDVYSRIRGAHLDFLIVPAAGSNDIEEIFSLLELGVEVIVIDHHPIDDFENNQLFYDCDKQLITNCAVVNCNHPLNEQTDLNLTGAGMVYKFLESVECYISEVNPGEILDLVAIGQIGDASDISLNHIRRLVVGGMNNITNPFLQEALFQKIGDAKPTTQDMSYGVIPIVNAVCRVGDFNDKEKLFSALIQKPGLEEIHLITKNRKNYDTGKMEKRDIPMSGYQIIYEDLMKVKKKQANIVKKTVDMIKSNKEMLINSTGICFIRIPKLVDGSITGLLAQKMCGDLGKPCIMLQEELDGSILKGSGRCNDKYMDSLKDWCNESGHFIKAQGHDNAFGVEIYAKDFDNAVNASKEIKKTSKVHMVDVLYDNDTLSYKSIKRDITEALELKDIFGGTILEPFFGFKEIEINKRDIQATEKVFTIDCYPIKFICFTPPEWVDDLQVGFSPTIYLNIVGKPMISEWRGRLTYQILIEDMELVETPTPKIKEELTTDNFVF